MAKKSAAKSSVDQEIGVRIIVEGPPAGVMFCLQSGRSDLVGRTMSTGEDLKFECTIRVKDLGRGTPPRLLGEFVQGATDARFVYINSGTSAGQVNTCWTRRAKVPLSGITWPMIRAVVEKSGDVLEAHIGGTARDGGPVCASVELVGEGWRVV